MLKQLARVEPAHQVSFVSALAAMGGDAVGAVPDLISHFRSPDWEVMTKAAIIKSLGLICGPPESEYSARADARRLEVRSLMLEAMNSEQWPVVWGAADGLKHTGGLPPEAIKLLASRLDSPFSEERGMAAQSLGELKLIPESVISRLVHRLEVEDRNEVVSVIISALAAAGTSALPKLLAKLMSDDIKVISRIGEVFIKSGGDTARVLAGELLANPDQNTREYFIAILHRMGPRGLPAFTVAIELLDHPDALVRQHGAMAICYMGPNAKDAVPRLIELLNDPNLETAHWAQKGHYLHRCCLGSGAATCLP